LPNRHLLKDRLEQALSRSRRMESSLAVMFVDLDRFKPVNDTLGHAVGDELLVQVADRLTSCVRGYDTLARFGGDEFVIIAEEEGQQGIVESASMLSRRLLDLFRRPFLIGERELYVSASIGVAVFPRDADSADDLIRSADAAMYQAKAGGRNAVCFFHRDLNERLISQVEMAADLRHAIERGEFSLVYQPKVARLTGRVAGAEALLRWTHPQRGPVPPGQFIPVAEEAGLIGEIGAWVLREACIQAREWRDLGIERFHVAVNVSGAQFRQPEFCENVRRIIEETGVFPEELELEITESITIEDSEKSVRILDQLHDMGVRISVDDFGTGYSSLSYLQQFRVHRLKVDRAFIQADPSKSSSRSIVRAIVALGHGLGLLVTAEGVETKEQLDFVTDCGCDEVQGFYVSRPLSVEAFLAFARGTRPGTGDKGEWNSARGAAGSG
ncbi:MAG TPA: EAL domain-containing protein, partial [Gammaproteobacteria bacterium]